MRLAQLFSPWIFAVLSFAAEISPNVYNELVHYAHYSKLAQCISKPDMLNEGLRFNEGGCHIEFCHTERNSNVEVLKIHVAGIDESGTSFVAVDHKNKEVVVIFRASVTTSDWISDFYILQTPYHPIVSHYTEGISLCEGCKVHLGFYQHMNYIFTKVIDNVLDVYANHPTYRLVLVGHSLGAAMASLTAVEFKVMGFHPYLYTYGGPKIFNQEMQTWINDIFESKLVTESLRNGGGFGGGYLRVFHDGDYVPMLPPGFKQAGVELFISKRNLPHEIQDVEILGLSYADVSKKTTDTMWKILHGYEHRTYFMTINKCEDVDLLEVGEGDEPDETLED